MRYIIYQSMCIKIIIIAIIEESYFKCKKFSANQVLRQQNWKIIKKVDNIY